MESIEAGFKGKHTLADWTRDLKVRCEPIRAMELQDITTNDVLAVLSPIWMTINRTARETRSRIERVLDAAESKGLRSGKNPAMWKTLKPLLPKAKRSKRHHRAAPYKDVPGIVQALREKHRAADTAVNLAAEYIIVAAIRTGEARFMRVRVPLCDRAIAILKSAIPKDTALDAYVFAGQ